MKQLLLIVGAALSLTSVVGVPPAFAAASDGSVLATVNGQPITQEELVQRLMSYYGKSSLEAMINRMLVNQEAKRLDVSVTDAEIDTRLGLIKNQLGGAEGYSRWLAQSGLTEAQHKEQVRATMLTEKIVAKTDPVKDSELEQAVVRIILLPSETDARSVETVLKNGGDFIQLARERSTDQQTAAQGGLLPPIMRAEYPDVWKAIANLKPGQTTAPVKLGGAYAVLKLEQRLPVSKQNEQEKERNHARLLSVKLNEWLDATRKHAKITYGAPLPQRSD
jgi:foldase protein PrsA